MRHLVGIVLKLRLVHPHVEDRYACETPRSEYRYDCENHSMQVKEPHEGGLRIDAREQIPKCTVSPPTSDCEELIEVKNGVFKQEEVYN